MTECLDQSEALETRQKKINRQISLVAEAQLALIQAPREQVPRLTEAYKEIKDELEVIQKQARMLKKVIDDQDHALDFLDRQDQTISYRPRNAEELYREAEEGLNRLRSNTIKAISQIESEDTPDSVCPIPKMEIPDEGALPLVFEKVSEKPEDQYTWYYAFGSNMPRENIEKRVGKVGGSRVARVENYRLVFDKIATKAPEGTGFANIVEDPGDTVYGVIYQLDDRQLQRLDKFEGGPSHYKRMTIDVIDEQNRTVPAQVYIAVKRAPGLKPSRAYLNSIIKGAVEHNLPEEYIDELKEIETTEKSQVQTSVQKPEEKQDLRVTRQQRFRETFNTDFNEKNCPKIPSKKGYPNNRLKELAKEFGIDPKGMRKAELCAKMARLLVD